MDKTLRVPLSEFLCEACSHAEPSSLRDDAYYLRTRLGSGHKMGEMMVDVEIRRLRKTLTKGGAYELSAELLIHCPKCQSDHVDNRMLVDLPLDILRNLATCANCGGTGHLQNTNIELVQVDEYTDEIVADASFVCDACSRIDDFVTRIQIGIDRVISLFNRTGRPLTKDETPTKAEDIKHRADVLLVTVNPIETAAVLNAFEGATGHKPKSIYHGSRVYDDLGQINKTRVLHTHSQMGSINPGAMVHTVDDGIRHLNPGSVIAVGIAFGVDEKKQHIGDILISRFLRLYDQRRKGKETDVWRGARPPASARLISYFERAIWEWKECQVRPGVILTGESLVDNSAFRAELLQGEPEAVGGEMEGAGLFSACNRWKVDWILVKAISDWADGNKGHDQDVRQKCAAENAVAFILQALKSSVLPGPERV